MPLNNAYDEQAVIQAIASALETFYGTLIEKIDGLNIQKVMKRKNPYLYRAKAMQSATEIVDSVLTAFVSSSEETIFGNCFFEPIAIAASGGNKALAEGIDIMIQNNETNTISAIAVKSGPSVFNADSKKRQEQNFTAASKLAQQAKARYFSNGTPNRLMTPEEIQDATNEIKTNYISDFDYDTEYQKTQDITVLKELYQNSGSNYEKLQIYRIMFNENSSNSVIKKFVNEAFHIENDYLFQLNPCEYDTVPQYIIDECDKDILEICPQG